MELEHRNLNEYTMANPEKVFDAVIAGGGLAGLSMAILLAQKGYQVVLLEKKQYPYHKVCGEYISNESRAFLTRLGIALDALNLPQITTVQLMDTKNNLVTEKLDPGGFGISRYTLDTLLANRATMLGVSILQGTNCSGYVKQGDLFSLNTSSGIFKGKMLLASFGRHAFGNFYKPHKSATNWVGVKYHIKADFAEDKIYLATFRDGYCGMSKIEEGKYCLCYLVKASRLNIYRNKIQDLEQQELFRNPFLKEVFSTVNFLYEKPLTISNVTFTGKAPVYDDVFYLGDSAGSIAPLTGNGMSNAMRSASLLVEGVDQFLQKKISRQQLRESYTHTWKKTFSKRIYTGRLIQYFFCDQGLSSFFIRVMQKSRLLRLLMIRQTHGDVF